MASVGNQTSHLLTLGNQRTFSMKNRSNNTAQASSSKEKPDAEKINSFGDTRSDFNSCLDRTPDDAVLSRGTRPNILLPPQVLRIILYATKG